VILFHLTVDEVLRGMTREAARAFGRFDRIGSLDVGKACDVAIRSAGRPAEIFHTLGHNPFTARILSAVVTARCGPAVAVLQWAVRPAALTTTQLVSAQRVFRNQVLAAGDLVLSSVP
jgi:cytosine/adenosine deaminase-related metal-dependent hydrolase